MCKTFARRLTKFEFKKLSLPTDLLTSSINNNNNISPPGLTEVFT